MVEVKDKQQLTLFKHQYLVAVVLRPYVLRLWLEHVEARVQLYHFLLEVVQKVVSQITVVRKIPSSSAVMVRPAVALTGEVNPFRMSELVAHESQITLTSETECQESDHFMQSHSSENSRSFLIQN